MRFTRSSLGNTTSVCVQGVRLRAKRHVHVVQQSAFLEFSTWTIFSLHLNEKTTQQKSIEHVTSNRRSTRWPEHVYYGYPSYSLPMVFASGCAMIRISLIDRSRLVGYASKWLHVRIKSTALQVCEGASYKISTGFEWFGCVYPFESPLGIHRQKLIIVLMTFKLWLRLQGEPSCGGSLTQQKH